MILNKKKYVRVSKDYDSTRPGTNKITSRQRNDNIAYKTNATKVADTTYTRKGW